MPSNETASSEVLQKVMEYLNDDPDVCYAMSYNPTLQCWNVIKMVRVETDKGERYGDHRVVPFANNHSSLVEAMKDAIKLKSASGT